MLYFKVGTVGRTFDLNTVSLRFSLDTDMRAETGVSLFTNMGVDYLVSIGEGMDGVWRWDSATESFEFVSDLTWQKLEGNLLEIGFPLSAINDAEEFALLVELNDDDLLEQDSAPDEGFALITKLPSWLKIEPLAGTADSGEEVPMTLTLNAEAIDQTGEILGPKTGTRSALSRQASQPPDDNGWQWIIVDPTITTVEQGQFKCFPLTHTRRASKSQ